MTENATPTATQATMNATLAQIDPEIAAVLDRELGRQRDYLEMIASENFVPRSVLQAQGSVLTNKYAEGYPGRRYYGGCEEVDVAETIAIERAKSPLRRRVRQRPAPLGRHRERGRASRAHQPGRQDHGPLACPRRPPHARHEAQLLRQALRGRRYGLDEQTHRIEMEQVREQALAERPDVIIAGWSAYPRHLDFAAFRAIADEVGAKLWTDMAHFAGLVAAGLHPSPVPHSDVVSTTVHKTLGGPRSGLIVSRDEELAKKLNSAVFPGQQGGPLMHVIAAKADRAQDRRGRRVQGAPGARARGRPHSRRAPHRSRLRSRRASTSSPAARTCTWCSPTCATARSTASRREHLLHEVGITVNRNAVPFDPRPPMVTSGVRIGTPALATRGFGAGRVHRGCRRHRDGAQGRRRHRARSGPGSQEARGRLPALPRPQQ